MLSEDSKRKIIEEVSRKAGDQFETRINCAQSTLAALQEEFDLGGGKDVIKAAAFMPGLAARKEACGAMMGALLALGLALGIENISSGTMTPEAAEKKYRARDKARKFCETFKAELGSTTCGDIRVKIMGPEYVNYDNQDSKWRERYIKEGGPKKCRVPVEAGARIAAAILLEEE